MSGPRNGTLRFVGKMLHSGWRQASHDRGSTVATLASFAVVTLAFGFLLSHTNFTDRVPNPPHPHQMVWYFLTVESILMAYQGLRGDILNRAYTGHTIIEMGYPRPLWQQYIPYMMGMGIYHSIVLSLFASVMGYIITGAMPPVTLAWLLLPVTMLFSLALYTLFAFLLAMMVLRWRLGKSFQYMMGKFFFLLGGIVVPPLFFPGLWGDIIPLLPFNAFLHSGASPQLFGSSGFDWLIIALQPVWFVVLLWWIVGFANRTARMMQKTGEGA